MNAKSNKFCTSFAEDGGFRGSGLRDYFEYRDLGIGTATQGRYHAQVIRARQAVSGGMGRHYHTTDFQMVYVLKGWVKFVYEGEGEILFRPGDAVLQPPEIRHELIECSDNLELLEITSPADFDTVELDAGKE